MIDISDVVVARGSRVAGIVQYVDPGPGLACVSWPAGCGLPAWVSLHALHRLAPAQDLLEVLQEIVTPLLQNVHVNALKPNQDQELVVIDQREYNHARRR